MQTLVKLDRLPKGNTIEALELLQQAWVEHDIAIHRSKQYLRLASVLYAAILLVGVATVTSSTVFNEGSLRDQPSMVELSQHIVFGLSMLSTALPSILQPPRITQSVSITAHQNNSPSPPRPAPRPPP